MNISINFDEILKLQAQFGIAPKVMNRAINSSLKSGLFHIRKKLRAAITENEFEWPKQKAFPTVSDIEAISQDSASGILSGFLRGQKKIFEAKDRPFFGKLGRLLFYNYDESKYSGEVGAVNAKGQAKIGEKAKEIWGKLQTGYEKTVSAGARRFFGAIGIPIRASTTMFHIPARPLFGPVAVKRADEVNKLLMAVIAEKVGSGFVKTDFLDKAFAS